MQCLHAAKHLPLNKTALAWCCKQRHWACVCSAMGGAVLFEDALAARLDLMRPSRATLAAFLAAHSPRLTPGALLNCAVRREAWALGSRAHCSFGRPSLWHAFTACLTVPGPTAASRL